MRVKIWEESFAIMSTNYILVTSVRYLAPFLSPLQDLNSLFTSKAQGTMLLFQSSFLYNKVTAEVFANAGELFFDK